MKTLLIIYPHWVPSNLAGVHRPRLIANFLKEFGWQPILLTVSPDFYEEIADPDIARTASKDIEVVYTKAYNVTKPRVVGDIGLRAFPFLYRKSIEIVNSRKIDFIWIPIPSFYSALLGRLIHSKTGVPYGIDYIDPWVRDISNRQDWRSKFSLLVAKCLEPIAVKKAALISGVSTAYYAPVLERNFKDNAIAHVGMPYGFDPNDHDIIIDKLKLPWSGIDCEPLVYAGAFLPNSHLFVKLLFQAIKEQLAQGAWDKRKQLFFLGTGLYAGTTIADYAKQYDIEDIVHEVRERFPFLHVLNFLSAAYAVMIIGSTEKHYTPSKTFQALLSKRPVFGIFHHESSAVNVLQECQATALLVEYQEQADEQQLRADISAKLQVLLSGHFKWKPELDRLEKYSAKASAKALVQKLDQLV
ncbi:glycosyltransferase family protein [Pontibacter pamirensis]|uniref:glycosyltransferase family 4 protein n=1 Tax=Pontibacter pamirensis TaxID=2562824 RepID=UPI00138A5FB5|nr:glycosyltransferase family 4 protein [Pontibacter pamirensis]